MTDRERPTGAEPAILRVLRARGPSTMCEVASPEDVAEIRTLMDTHREAAHDFVD